MSSTASLGLGVNLGAGLGTGLGLGLGAGLGQGAHGLEVQGAGRHGPTCAPGPSCESIARWRDSPAPIEALDPLAAVAQSQDLALKVAKLETTVDHIKSETSELKTELRDFRQEVHLAITAIRTHDFRILFGALIAVALGLTAVMAKGFHWI
ncbi:hypothetical protein [Roseateles amylovorans]|uniref:DUF1640 domain-containing protein n=1 Tax=Roseateles amylovorans TaxID=2978473 RepID=A0ABY6AT34_9BURK|nr:hypothetical protein [Roseateles amylovorans]UXH76396.1 hypothetical protein N4261_15150 [Roseateles amylovorans]